MIAACCHLRSLSFRDASDVLDWYDGPVSCITICPKCGKYYGFAMLDWSQQERYRLFMLTLLSRDDVAQYKAIYQFNTGDTLSKEDSDKATIIVRPKSSPDALVLWDSSDDIILKSLPVPNIAYESGLGTIRGLLRMCQLVRCTRHLNPGHEGKQRHCESGSRIQADINFLEHNAAVPAFDKSLCAKGTN